MAAPYQPSLLRLLHGLTALLIGLCWFTGFAVYSEFDGRWGRVPLRLPEAIVLHGSVAVLLILVSALFVPYALTIGRARLRRSANAVALRIEAGAAFGTGHHGTTVGCLLAWNDLIKARRFDKVLVVCPSMEAALAQSSDAALAAWRAGAGTRPA